MSDATTEAVVTRFAPSPTGYLHIGGARTALFNWLYAKANNGKMLLRIEDTDRQRSSQEAIDALIDGLTWLGLDWEGDPISQFARAERHREVAEQLVQSGKAYYCYATPEELAEMREKARSEGKPTTYDRRWRDRPLSEAPTDVKPAVRIKAPLEGETIVRDKVQGDVKFPNKDLDDMVILRSDGTPTYMLAVVVDDHDMGVTHIIRGDDHLTNAARQTIIYEAMEWHVPTMAHIPLIHGPDGAKLSKRHGAVGAEAYRAMGYLPEAMRNYLVRLGWSHGDDEIISTEQMIEWFGFDGMGKAASRFDFAKLENLCGHYIKNREDSALANELLQAAPYFENGSEIADKLNAISAEKLIAAMPLLKDRAKTLITLAQSTDFLTAARPLKPDEKAKNQLGEAGQQILREIISGFLQTDAWKADTINEVINDYCAAHDTKFGKVAQPIRAALTGTTVSPSVSHVMELLGKEESLARISDRL